jgi:hypothetical protein
MRFMTMVKGVEKPAAGPPPPALFDAIARLGEEAAKAGVFVEMGGLLPSAAGASVRLANGKITVTDGPFSETKELVGGYAIYNVKSRQEAVDWAVRFMELHKQHWKGWEGEVEVRQLMDQPPR